MQTQTVLTARQFEELFLKYRLAFIKKAYRYVRDREVAADIVSECFMSFWEKRHTLTADINIPAYIFTSIKNRCLNHLRDKALHVQAEQNIHSLQRRLLDADIASLTACNPDRLFQKEIYHILERALIKMPSQTREVFQKSRFKEMSYYDIAQDMGLSFSYVHLEIRRGLNILRLELKDYLISLILLVFIPL